MRLKKHTYKNGLRLVTVHHPDSIATTVLVLVAAGSEYESKPQSGLSHFLEHLCFKGTANRPSSLAISGEFDSLGAKYNAFTAQEYTGYYATVMPKHLPRALNLIADMYLNPIFPPPEIEKEKGVIIEEINLYEDTPARRVQDLFMSLLYGDQPAGWNIAGTKETIRAMNQKSFFDYRRLHYVARGTIVVVAGAFRQNKITADVGREFTAIASGRPPAKRAVREAQTKPGLAVKFKDSGQAHLVLGFRSFNLFHPAAAALDLLAAVLGGGMSSRLFRRVREEMGAAYYVRATNDPYTDHGVLAAAAGVDINKTPAVVRAMVEEFRRLTEELVPADELRRTKDALIGRLYLELETSNDLALFFGLQEILKKKILTPDEWSARIERVTAESLRRLARQIFKNRRLNLAVTGPFKEKKRFEAELHL